MRKILTAIVFMCLAGANALAADVEANIKATLQKRWPDIAVESVSKTPLPGIYEVFAGDQLYYTDEKARYILDGQLFDLERNANLSDERLMQLTSVKFDHLPLELALKRVKGDGSRKIAYFGDPDCPYCRQLEQELAKINNVTIYTFLYPLSIHPNADSIARKIWCSQDPGKTWTDYMLDPKPNRTVPTGDGSCATPIEKIRAFAYQIKIDGTPTMFFADGQRVSGVLPAEQIEKHFSDIQSKN